MSRHGAASDGRVEFRNYLDEDFSGNLAGDVKKGLEGAEKSIPSKYFYDARGSKLFEEICAQPEYYPTRTEMGILRESAGEIMALFSSGGGGGGGVNGGDLVELGSGANWKVKILLSALDPDTLAATRYVPLDVSEAALAEAARGLATEYPSIRVLCVVGDFLRHLDRLAALIDGGRPKLYLFLGSTIGNFMEDESEEFMANVASAMGPADRFLLGLDMVKPREILEAAYNDANGLSAEFNRNIIRVIDRELGAGLDPGDFDHVAFFNEQKSRVEMHLRARRVVRVRSPGADIDVVIAEGETIRTEVCRKFTPESAREMFEKAGLEPERWFFDENRWFSVVELKKAA